MPAPYRKSCRQCAKSKRKCDLADPCWRCQSKSLICQYDTSHATSTTQSPPLISPTDTQNFPTDSNYNDGSEADQMAGLIAPESQGSDLLLSGDFDRYWPEVMANIDKFTVPDIVGLYNSPERSVLAGQIYQERIVYSVKRFQSYPSLLVHRGRNPFIHPALYTTMPVAIQDALAVSALYQAKNEANQTLVFATLTQKPEYLIESYDRQKLSALEQLASTQALIIYHIIRLFDGDVRLRSDAENVELTLIDWARQIQLRIQRAGSETANDLLLASTDSTVAWRLWLFAESQRRTVMMCFALQGLYCFLKNGWDSSHHDFDDLSFYVQKALWAAPSEYHWRSAVAKKRLLHVHFRSWDAEMASAEPSDVDDLGMVMMVLMKGVDHCSEWVGEQDLETHGFGLSKHSGE